MCFEKRTIPVVIVTVASLAAIACAVAMAALSFVLTESDLLKKLEEDKELEDIKTVRNLVFLTLLIFAVLALLVSILGFCSWCCKNKCFYCLWGSMLIPTTLIVLIFGALCYVFATASDETLTDECKKQLDKWAEGADQSFSAGSEEIDISMNLYVDSGLERYMCTTSCPCKPVDATIQATWTDVNADLPATGRTGSFPYDFTGTYTSYKECIEGADQINSTIEFSIFAKNFREQSNYDDINKWLEFFELEYSCAGICEPALFSWQGSIENGRPTTSCLSGIKDAVGGDFKNLGLAAIFCSLMLFVAFIFQYCLWKDFDGM